MRMRWTCSRPASKEKERRLQSANRRFYFVIHRVCVAHHLNDRPDLDDDADSKEAPTKKAKVTDFFGKAGSSGSGPKTKTTTEKKTVAKSMKPRSPPKPKKAAPKIIKSDDDDSGDNSDMYDDLPKPPPRAASSRAARGVTKTYVDISDGDDDGDGSIFVD